MFFFHLIKPVNLLALAKISLNVKKYYTFVALVVRRYESCLPEEVIFLEGEARENVTYEGNQNFISPYNKGHTLFIIPKLHTQQQNIFLIFYSICVVVYVDGYIAVIRKKNED